MYRITLIIILIMASSWSAFGQSPQKFKFQAIARDAADQPYVNTHLAVRISLVRGAASGLIDYSERHEVITSPVGVFDVEIGGGALISGNFSNANWASHSYYLKIDIDPNGGTNYITLGSSQLLSVPYAIYASQSGSGTGGGDPTDELQSLVYDAIAQTLTLTDGNTVSLNIPSDSDNQSLSFNSITSELTISNGNSIIIPAGNGQVGPQGPIGPQGIPGEQGAIGMTGAQGPIGPQGVPGMDGATGAQGVPGAAGMDGAIGAQGPQGIQGPAGAGVQIVGSVATISGLDPAYSGSTGDMFISQNDGHGHVWNGSSWDDVGQIQGPAGPQGIPGEQGAIGMTGAQGLIGPQGVPGMDGATGAQGVPGVAGVDGAIGAQGPQGIQGPAGAGVQIVGSVATISGLDPAYSGSTGDMFISQNDGHGHVWNGSSWDDVGQIQGPAGPQGIPGEQGAIGIPGAQGPIGPQGVPGMDGATGEQGVPGAAGMDGAIGVQGPQGIQGPAGAGVQIVGSVATISDLDPAYSGSTGDMFISQNDGHGHVWNGSSWDDVGQIQGPAGPQGIPGAQGPQGPQGLPGSAGMDGATGAQGIQGVPGSAGMDGATGAQGPQGLPGLAGMDGATGAQGPQGLPGSAGMDGATGAQGIQGVPGPAGMDGATGAQGPQGLPGLAGMDGVTGAQGIQGVPGPAGMDGATGAQGIQGVPGPAGMDGATGPQGPIGPAGSYSPGMGISISGDVISAVDASSTNEIQNLSLAGNNLQISGGNSVSLTGIGGSSLWTENAANIFYNSGYVGIGINTPNSPLHVKGGTLLQPVASLQGENPWLGYYDNSETLKGNLWYDMVNDNMVLTNNEADGEIRFNINFDYKMTIDKDGDVGIGTTAPANKLHVVGDMTIDDSTPSVQLYDGANWRGYLYSDGSDMVLGNVHNNSILFQTNALTRAEIDSDGMTLNGASGTLEMKTQFTTGPIIRGTNNGNPEAIRIASSGVSISELGTVNPGNYMLRIVEKGNFGLNLYNGNTENDWELFADGTGNLQLWADNVFRGSFDGTSGVYTSVSDEKLKTNIRDLGSLLENVMTLKPSRYEYVDNNPGKKESIGFVAQDVQKIFPELVQINEGERLGEVLSLDYAGFGVIAIKAVQELNEQVNLQQNTIDSLEESLKDKSIQLEQQQQQIDALSAKLNRLEGLLGN